MEGIQLQTINRADRYAERIIAKSRSRSEANAEMRQYLDKDYVDFETLPREEKIKILNEYVKKFGATEGDTTKPQFNENQYLVEAFAFRLHMEEKAMFSNFKSPDATTNPH